MEQQEILLDRASNGISKVVQRHCCEWTRRSEWPQQKHYSIHGSRPTWDNWTGQTLRSIVNMIKPQLLYIFYTDTIHLHMVVRTQLLLPTNQGVDNSKDWSSITLGQKQRSKKPPTGIHWIRVCPYLFSFGFAGFCPTGSSLDALSYCMLETFRDRLVALRAMMRAKFRFRVAVWCSLMHSVSFCVLWGQGCVSFDLGGDRSICRTDSFAEMFSKIATKRHFVGTG